MALRLRTFLYASIALLMVVSMLVMSLDSVKAGQTENSDVNDRDTGALQEAFTEASEEFNVPLHILMSVAYNESRWNHHDGDPSVSGGYGIMHLTDIDQDAATSAKGDAASETDDSTIDYSDYNTLVQAAELLDVDPNELKNDPVQNIRGGAALLESYAKETFGEAPAALSDWYGAVAKYSGSNNEAQATDFADRVYETIQEGAESTLEDGQHVVLSSEEVTPNRKTAQSLDLNENLNEDVNCPPGLDCEYIPANYKQYSDSPSNYGNYDLANRPEDGLDIRYIVIHNTEGSYQSAVNWFQAQSYVSAQYVIRSSDGKIAEMVKPEHVAWQAGNWYFNTHSIGIEHEGFAVEGATWYSETMYRASAQLVKYLAERYDIPLDREHIIGHDNVPGTTPAVQSRMHWDPGTYWDWDHYMNLVGEKESKPPKHKGASWESDGVVRISPNFQTNQPSLTYKGEELEAQPSNFVYLHTEPSSVAPLISDQALQSEGQPGTREITDWGNKAVAGQHFVRVDRSGDWSAINYGGQKAWFHDPNGKNSELTNGMLITPKDGKDSIPIYGTAYPEDSAYAEAGIPEFQRVAPEPLQYMIPSEQTYVANGPFQSDYYYSKLYDKLNDNKVVKGNDEYYQISFNHRIAFVKKSKVVKGNDEYYQISFNHRIAFVKKSDVDIVVTSVNDIQEIVRNFDEMGAFTSDKDLRALNTRLTSIQRFEDNEQDEKFVKDLKELEVLIDDYSSKDLISDSAYEALQAATQTLITKIEGIE